MRSKIAIFATLAALIFPAAAQAAVVLLGVDAYPAFQNYIMEEHIPSFAYQGPIEVGAMLPPAGFEFYPVPPQFSLPPAYRYTIINGEPVIVDPYHRIVQVVPSPVIP